MSIALPDAAQEIGDICREVLGRRRLILASNRGPVEYRAQGGEWEAHRGCGGVAIALAAVARYVRLAWVASAITDGDRWFARWLGRGNGDGRFGHDARCRLHFVVSPREAYNLYYNLISNPILWFLQHSLWQELADRPALTQEILDGWDYGYRPVNHHFARAILAELSAADTAPYVMLHDYHLYLAPAHVRAGAPFTTLSHFIHIPWPPPAAWSQLPSQVATAICRGLLANDVVTFQTAESAANFLETCQSLVSTAWVDLGAASVSYRGRLIRVRHRPISVDVADLRQRMASAEVSSYRQRLSPLCGSYTLVRVDRLGPSKNVATGFQAFDLLLRRHPELRGQVKFLAFLVPSRTIIPEYARYRDKVLRLVEEINLRHRQGNWRPIEVFYENNYSQALAGMSLYDVLLVNPLADGMNLVSKEGPIVNERDGVLVLSRKAGSHGELAEGALSIEPTDVEATAEALARALFMPQREKSWRAARLRRIIEQNDLSVWLRNQLEDLRASAQERSLRVAQ